MGVASGRVYEKNTRLSELDALRVGEDILGVQGALEGLEFGVVGAPILLLSIGELRAVEDGW